MAGKKKVAAKKAKRKTAPKLSKPASTPKPSATAGSGSSSSSRSRSSSSSRSGSRSRSRSGSGSGSSSSSRSRSRSEYFPTGLEAALIRHKAPAVDAKLLLKRIKEEGGTPDPKWGAFIPSAELARRYGFALPSDLVSLLELGDRYLIEDLSEKMPSFRYLRIAPGGWELPDETKGEPYAVTVAKRFDWNTFSNMQLWEHFAGTMSLGWDPGDNRYMVSTVSADAPVFWMDNETAKMGGAVASSLERFLRVQVGEDASVPELERKLVRAPSVWEREGDELRYLDAPGPLTAWPPFLAARANWLVACIAFGGVESMLDRPEVGAFDLAKELPLIAGSEPLALYWMQRAFYLEERDVFQEVAPRARGVSPLAASFAEVLERNWAKPSANGAKIRKALKQDKRAPRKAQWGKGMSAGRLV